MFTAKTILSIVSGLIQLANWLSTLATFREGETSGANKNVIAGTVELHKRLGNEKDMAAEYVPINREQVIKEMREAGTFDG